jgi:hypothetical protein
VAVFCFAAWVFEKVAVAAVAKKMVPEMHASLRWETIIRNSQIRNAHGFF